uniref:Uncharacterized protein n=1 Tax=Dunaliella tertiolecta TaxID=3047 RepID=A0A7S3VJS8_DUNTE|eukprot:1154237-Pelagomonas_calceolata.AAC.17
MLSGQQACKPPKLTSSFESLHWSPAILLVPTSGALQWIGRVTLVAPATENCYPLQLSSIQSSPLESRCAGLPVQKRHERRPLHGIHSCSACNADNVLSISCSASWHAMRAGDV